jgi:hypothetical protein
LIAPTVTTEQAIVQALAFFVCVGIGYGISRLIKPPESPVLWVLLVAAVFVVGYLPPLAIPVAPLGNVKLGALAWGVGIGIVAGFMFRQARRQA